MKRSVAFSLALIPFSGAASHAVSALPPIVEARIAADEKACGPEPAVLRPGFVTQKDVNGDGKPDYILNYEHLLCGSLPGFCGSGGCTSVVFASRGGSYVKAFDDLVGRVEFRKVGGRPAMLVLQRGGACGKGPQDACRTTRLWDGQRFAPAR